MKDNFDLSALISNKKKRTNSRTKGNTFERKVCAILNECFETTDFMRSPGSGAFSTTHKLPDYLRFSGDLITPKDFKYTIECKKGYNKENIGSIFNPKSEFRKFIEQSERDASKIQKNFLLIFQQDRQEILGIINSHGSRTLKSLLDNLEMEQISFKFNNETYFMFPLEKGLLGLKSKGLLYPFQ